MQQVSQAQNYQAIHGSPYAGSLGIYNNPASGIHSYYNWDITLFSVQSKSSTNGFSSTKPFIKLRDASVYLSNGDMQRYAHMNQDLHVLNGMIKLNHRSAVAFGFNTRNYLHVKSNAFKFLDTISSFNSFLQFNRPSPSFGGKAIQNAWVELYASYSRIIRNTSVDQLSAGMTIKVIRGVSGIYTHLNRALFTEVPRPGLLPSFVLTDANGKYGYSSNYDKLEDNSNSTRDFLNYTQGSLGIDLGAEYVIKSDYPPQYDDPEQPEYDWKIGISVLDLGRNLFKHGKFSRMFNGVKSNITDEDLENKFSSPDNIEDFYDSLMTVVAETTSLGPEFHIWQPTRLVINVDRPIINDFSINGELSINFFSTQNSNSLHTRELNMLTLTPRWETSLLGLYLPIQLNTQGQVWVGSAFKAGPLLMGIHDWRWLLSKNHAFSGGAYIALVVRDFFSSPQNSRRLKGLECPPFK